MYPRTLILTILAVGGCHQDVHREAEERSSTVLANDPLPPYDAHATWSHYEFQEHFDKSKVLYYWNNENIGVGMAGFREMLSRIKRMPKGSRLLLYPSLPYNFEMWPAQPPHGWPFDDEFKQLEQTIVDADVRVYWSQKDTEGRVFGPDGKVDGDNGSKVEPSKDPADRGPVNPQRPEKGTGPNAMNLSDKYSDNNRLR